MAFEADFEAWTVDLATLSATHDSGFTIQIEGSPKDPSAVNPGRFPEGLSGVEQARLLRYGMEAIAKASLREPSASLREPSASLREPSASLREPSSRQPVKPKKPAYTPPANKPKRTVLSLKKRQQEDA